MAKPGKDFEVAVFKFAQSLDKSARPHFNYKVRDRDTGEWRQCDVWIEAMVGGHWPYTVLVSCKDHGRQLGVKDIETFAGEIRSTGASMGVIYSHSGFAHTAIVKAKANNITCCRLYTSQPPDIPSEIWFEWYACYPTVLLEMLAWPPDAPIMSWNQFFDEKAPKSESTFLKVLCDEYAKLQTRARTDAVQSGKLPGVTASELIMEDASGNSTLRLKLNCGYSWYQHRREATAINGSYCFNNNTFIGQQLSPALNLRSSHPGAGWRKITEPDFKIKANSGTSILIAGDIGETLREQFGATTIELV